MKSYGNKEGYFGITIFPGLIFGFVIDSYIEWQHKYFTFNIGLGPVIIHFLIWKKRIRDLGIT